MHVYLLFKVGHTSLPLTSCIVKREQFSAFRFRMIHTYTQRIKQIGLKKNSWRPLISTLMNSYLFCFEKSNLFAIDFARIRDFILANSNKTLFAIYFLHLSFIIEVTW